MRGAYDWIGNLAETHVAGDAHLALSLYRAFWQNGVPARHYAELVPIARSVTLFVGACEIGGDWLVWK
jgi:hypothetical protein